MTKEAPGFSDFITDKDGDYSKAQFMALGQRLLREGRRPDRVFLAMYRAAMALSIGHSIGEHYELIRTIRKDLNEYAPQLESEIDRIIADRNESRQ
jgi:hypothetical protein